MLVKSSITVCGYSECAGVCCHPPVQEVSGSEDLVHMLHGSSHV
jgi:hypothetical protein